MKPLFPGRKSYLFAYALSARNRMRAHWEQGSKAAMKTTLYFAIGLLATLKVFPQPPLGTLQVKITPGEIEAGDSVWFEAGLYSNSQCEFQSTYTIALAGPESDSFLVVIKSQPAGRRCAALTGYSGPQLHIMAEDPGHYTVRFDSASPFKPDMGDTAVFLVKAATSILNHPAARSVKPGNRPWRVDGRAIEPAPGRRRAALWRIGETGK